ncbi:type VII secretion protein EsxD [Mycobacterium koreense]|uniref:Uncharacterized protein n=1 Tax=Mycolicibacillus koreensis TaxID=1069220 RepID=A0A7I7SG27_9MYCO|nr:hypothetical protein [Mycolicibacillus koreensis]MCV7250464.1 type VII secretion protein EsxD [Mycolicibacillus koreensis]ODR04180.1 hypothetical protein BHQ15_17440 [Mycolicibacillus koreensis]OSC27767.1 hypothetical protein B8W67_17935 [Mycolicibacillus koreensis]BBY55768.1 hypothetical protein MKOR_30190 [Mycolicibacillus koreensis]
MGNIPAGGGVIVTPDMMLEAQRAIENALVDAQTVANQYLSSHEDAAPGYAGDGYNASYATAIRIQADMTKLLTAGTSLAHGLGKVAMLMQHHEMTAAQNFTAFAPDTAAGV